MQSLQIIFEFFWLVCGVFVGVGNAAFFRSSLSSPIARGEISQSEANRFAIGVVGWITGPCLALWIIQRFLAASPDVDFRLWASPFNHVATGIVVAVWIAAFAWIWFFSGDQKLARIYTLARYQSFIWGKPFVFRIGIVLVILAGTLSLTLGEPLSLEMK
ncbi:hypothetical protein [Congregicoccus parvus]|uniref:hypothetical protein n=1 Tax=Congregicoccus parvus TaxID=3081749 RepID=UPI003FA59110